MLKQLVMVMSLVTFFGALMQAQENSGTGNKDKQECMKDSKSCCGNHGMQSNMKTDSMNNSSMVREGEIDLNAIDKNIDGKVFQDQMDWNVISDEPGKCPLCGMKLKEVSLEKAKENLINHGFKVEDETKEN